MGNVLRQLYRILLSLKCNTDQNFGVDVTWNLSDTKSKDLIESSYLYSHTKIWAVFKITFKSHACIFFETYCGSKQNGYAYTGVPKGKDSREKSHRENIFEWIFFFFFHKIWRGLKPPNRLWVHHYNNRKLAQSIISKNKNLVYFYLVFSFWESKKVVPFYFGTLKIVKKCLKQYKIWRPALYSFEYTAFMRKLIIL